MSGDEHDYREIRHLLSSIHKLSEKKISNIIDNCKKNVIYKKALLYELRENLKGTAIYMLDDITVLEEVFFGILKDKAKDKIEKTVYYLDNLSKELNKFRTKDPNKIIQLKNLKSQVDEEISKLRKNLKHSKRGVDTEVEYPSTEPVEFQITSAQREARESQSGTKGGGSRKYKKRKSKRKQIRKSKRKQSKKSRKRSKTRRRR